MSIEGEENLRNSIVYIKDDFYLCNFAEEYLRQSFLKGLLLYVEVEGAVLAMKGYGKFCGMCISAEPESPFKVGYFYVPLDMIVNDQLYERFVEGGGKVFKFEGVTKWNSLREQTMKNWLDVGYCEVLGLIRRDYYQQLEKPQVYDKEAIRFIHREYFHGEGFPYIFEEIRRRLVSFYNLNIAGFVDSVTAAVKRRLGKYFE